MRQHHDSRMNNECRLLDTEYFISGYDYLAVCKQLSLFWLADSVSTEMCDYYAQPSDI